MTAVPAEPAPAAAPAFSPRTILALVLVGIVSFAGLAVLAAYAPELRGGLDARAHALSKSAIGYRGAVVMLEARGVPVVVSRAAPKTPLPDGALLVLTPEFGTKASEMAAFPKVDTLVVLPKWAPISDPTRPGYVRKGSVGGGNQLADVLKAYSPGGAVASTTNVTTHRLHGVGGVLSGGELQLAPIDHYQILVGTGWTPILVDEGGQMLLARSKSHPNVLVLSEPDLLNTQGLASLDNARAGMAVLDIARRGGGVRFDVTLAGYERSRGIGRLLLEPPWLAATLCGVATALLMGFHALARFGPTRRGGRAFALGKRGLVDNSAGLVRMARREHELVPDYAALVRAQIARAGGGERGAETDRWLDDLARLRGAAAPGELNAEAGRAKTRGDVLAIGRKLYEWKLEMTRERR